MITTPVGVNVDYTTSLNTSSAIINSQLVPQTKTQWYTPLAVGPVIQGVPASPPQSPPGYAAGSSNANSAAAAMAANPWSLTQSPIPMMLIMFGIGYVLLRWIHWGYDTK